MQNKRELKTLNGMDIRAPLLLGGFVLTIYLLTLSPTINSFDSAEFVTGAYTLGIVHAPGYPLYLILAHFATLFPYASVPVIVNFLSAMFATLCIIVVFLTGYYLTKSYLWSSVSALMLAFSNLFWSRAVIAEVYSLNSLFVALLLFLCMLFIDTNSEKFLYGISLVAGFSLTHHTSVVLILPWLLISLVVGSKKAIKKSQLLTSLFLLLAPLSLYAYFPIRNSANPPLNYIRDYFSFIDLSSLQGTYWMISGQMFRQEMWGRSFISTFEQFVKLISDLWLNFFGVGLILALTALVYDIKNKKMIGVISLASVLSVLFFFSAYNVVDSREMITPAMVLLTPFISVGGVMLEKKIDGLQSEAPFNKTSIFLILLLTTMIAVNWTSVDRSGDWSAYKYAESVLGVVDANSLIITQWTAATPLEYMTIVEEVRPDVTIFDRGLYSLGIRALYWECQKDYDLHECSNLRDQALEKYIDEQLPVRPIYITEYDPSLISHYCLVDMQFLYRVLPLQACN